MKPPRLLGEVVVPAGTYTAAAAAQTTYSREPDVEPGEIARLIARRRAAAQTADPAGSDSEE